MNLNSMPPQPRTKRFQTVLLTLLLGVAAAASHAQSTTVNFSAGIGQRDVTYNGTTPVPSGNQVQVGYFTPGFDVSANAANPFNLANNWHMMGATNIQTIFGQDGHFGGILVNSDPQFSGQRICLWIFQTADNAAPVADFQNLLGYGLYSSTSSAWLFPQITALPPGNMTALYSSDVNQSYFGTFDSSHLILTQVPEPATWTLVFVGFAVWKARRRFI